MQEDDIKNIQRNHYGNMMKMDDISIVIATVDDEYIYTTMNISTMMMTTTIIINVDNYWHHTY